MPLTSDATVSAIILAGGRARRLEGQDKGLIQLARKPLVQWVLARVTPQVGQVVISANRHLDDYAVTGCPVIQDERDEFLGPLAGIAAAARATAGEWLLVVPCDTPFLPTDLVVRMRGVADELSVPLVRARDAQQVHFAVMLFQRRLLADLEQYLADGGRSVQGWQGRHLHGNALFGDVPNAFFNINTPDDLCEAETFLATEAAL